MVSSKSLSLFLCLLFLPAILSFVNEPNTDPMFLDIEEDMSSLQGKRVLQTTATNYSNIRIVANFDNLESAPASFKSYVQNDLLPPIIDWAQAALKVKYPVVGNLSISSKTTTICGLSVPSYLQITGVAADLMIFYNSKIENTSTVATTTSCLLATGTKRPLFATTSFNRNMFTEANGDILKHEKNTYLVMHEMTHALAFSPSLFKYFLDESGNIRTGHIVIAALNGANATAINVPPLTDRLRNFFGCSTLEGAFLEDDGGEGTLGSHFERRLFVYEMMSSGVIDGRKVSEFTMAMLEGSGWYVPDYSFAEPYSFGQGEGCGFIYGNCSNPGYSFDEFCTGTDRGCAQHGRAGGYCSTDSKADGCKYYFATTDYDCDNPNAVDNARLPDLQVFGRGLGSKCFSGNLSARSSSSSTSFCFKYNCTGTGLTTQISVQVGQAKVICKKEGPVTVSGYYGVINCPDPLLFCSTIGKPYCPRNCLGRGTCVNNQCVCKTGFTGIDCGLTA